VPAIAILLSAVIAVAMAGCAPALLRLLPSPPEDPLVSFVELGTRRFRLTLLAICLATGAPVLVATAPQLWPVWVPLVALGPLLGLIDGHTGFLPLRLTYLALALVIVGAVTSCWLRADWGPALVALGGGLGATACYWLLWRLSGGQLGFGDVRLAGVLGVATGATSLTVLVWSFVLGSLIGAVWAIVVRLRSGGREFPYGPSMLLGPPMALALTALWRVG
jgi:leader peptidase (prepilin peptidase)/N-methyltransferase